MSGILSGIGDLLGSANFTNDSDGAARRVRLRPKPGGVNQIYGTGILSQLRATNGMVWPYQPSIQYSQDVAYSDINVVHTNQDMVSYVKTHSVNLTVDGKFTVQNQTEGMYALACIHFLRSVTKMAFGRNDSNAGTPPPVLLFDGYGRFMFDSVPVIVKQFTVGLPDDVDYVPVDLGNLSPAGLISSFLGSNVPPGLQTIYNTTQQASSLASNNPLLPSPPSSWPNATVNKVSQLLGGPFVWLPAVFNISVQITTQQTPRKLDSFNLTDFTNGTLMKSNNSLGNLFGGISGNNPNTGGWV